MTILIFETNVSSTIKAFLSFTSTKIHMSLIIVKLNNLLAIFAISWLHKARSFMSIDLSFFELYLAKLTYYLSMSLFIMFFLFDLGYQLTTYGTSIVVSSTTNFMNSEFWDINWQFTSWTNFSFNWSVWYLVIVHIF